MTSEIIIAQNAKYNESLQKDRDKHNELIEARLKKYATIITTLSKKQHQRDDTLERERSIEAMNNLSPQSRRKLFLQKLEIRSMTIENRITIDEPPPSPNPFFNMSKEEANNIPTDFRFLYWINDLLFIFDARDLLKKGHAKLSNGQSKFNNSNTNHIELLTIPIDLPVMDDKVGQEDGTELNIKLDDDPEFETLLYTIVDPVVSLNSVYTSFSLTLVNSR